MKINKNFLFTAFCAVICFACKSNNENEMLSSLKGTQWKLAGIVDSQTDKLTVLEPADCEECYTLTFDTDSTLSTRSTSNDLTGKYISNNSKYSFHIITFGGTKVGEIGDGNLYVIPFWNKSIESFSLQKDELLLYYNDKKNYLLFKLQKS